MGDREDGSKDRKWIDEDERRVLGNRGGEKRGICDSINLEAEETGRG